MKIFAAQGPMLEVEKGDHGSLYYRKSEADKEIETLLIQMKELEDELIYARELQEDIMSIGESLDANPA